MKVIQREILVAPAAPGQNLLAHFQKSVQQALGEDALPIRFAVIESHSSGYRCEVAALEGIEKGMRRPTKSIFQLAKRDRDTQEAFNTVLLVPTGIGADIGGHAGDAGPVAKMLAAVSDRLITHPNVVNASDINELPENGLYVEGSVICRMLMGTAALQPVRANRVLVIMDAHVDQDFVDAAMNSISAARACYGLDVPRVVVMDPPISMAATYTESGCAAGTVDGLDRVSGVLEQYQGEYDAVAIASVIHVPEELHMQYFQSDGSMVNPWGGVEAMLTHSISSMFDVPSAHSPMLESMAIADQEPGLVDPRMAAEAISYTFLQCIFKGLQRSPRILTGPRMRANHGSLAAGDVSCLIIPDGCLGLPTLAALEQGIPVIAVKENKNLMKNDLARLPWRHGQFHVVENYWEAAGIIAAMRAGIAPEVVRRPLAQTAATQFVAAGAAKQAAAAGD